MDKLGIECLIVGPGVGQELKGKVRGIDFIKKHLGVTDPKKK